MAKIWSKNGVRRRVVRVPCQARGASGEGCKAKTICRRKTTSRKQFWQKDGRSAAKARLLEQLAKAEAAERREEEDAAGEGVGGDAQDHPEGIRRKSCIRLSSGSWRSQNEKFVALKGLPKCHAYLVLTVN
uniref:Uncharacterized protein n=1 Tax=Oryza barthii TaxID=65489 RepID=A0A679BCT8_9ORYZ|nr:hypothetical protein [Oryza barthii]